MIDQMASEALKRINEYIARCAAQQKRRMLEAWRHA
jgi:hypothetical protein